MYIKPSASDGDYTFFCKLVHFIDYIKSPILILGNIVICGNINLNSASVNVYNYHCYFWCFCSLTDKNVVENVNGGMLNVVLEKERDNVSDVRVSATDGMVTPDKYQPPVDIEVGIETVYYADSLDPTNINPSKDWDFNKCNFNRLLALLSPSWYSVLKPKDVATATDHFYNAIYNCFDECRHAKSDANNVMVDAILFGL